MLYRRLLTDVIDELCFNGIRYSLLIGIIISFLDPHRSNAQDVLISWDFSTYTGNENIGVATTVSSNISAISPGGEIKRGDGLTASNNGNRFNGRNWGLSDLAAAIAGDDYMEWTLVPESGYEITVTSVEYNFQKSNTGPTILSLRSDFDVYESDLSTWMLSDNTNNGLVTIINGVTNVTSALSFRLYGYGAGGTTGSGGFEGGGDDIIIYGTVSEVQDLDSEVSNPASQITGTSILSSSTTIESATDVFRFSIIDPGTLDLKSTKVTNIRLTPGTSNTADWIDHIQGLTLNNGASISIGNPDITDTYIDVPISSGNLDVNNSSDEVTLAVYLNTTALVDGAILSFLIDASNHGFTTDDTGSQFSDTFSGGNIASNDFAVDVQATKIQYLQHATDVLVNAVMTPPVAVAFTDINGNIDLSYATEQISIAANRVTLSESSMTLQMVQADGLATFNDLALTTFGTGTFTASDVSSSLSAPDIESISFEVTPVFSAVKTVSGSEASVVSSIINDPTITTISEGEQIWQFDLFDGDGVNPDNDGKPTNYTNITISQHADNQISNWQSVILAAGFFEGSVYIPGDVSVYPTNISFTPTSAISVTDGSGSNKTISLRISLKPILPDHSEDSKFVFELTEGSVSVEPEATSSQLGAFAENSDITSNAIDIEASKLLFLQQPTDVDEDQIMNLSVTVAFTDANGNIDVDYENSLIGISATNVMLEGGLVNESVMSDGLSTFSALSFSTSGTGTLSATDINDVLGNSEYAVSNSFEVIPKADHVTFVNVSSSGQVNQTIPSFTIEARRVDESIDLNYSGEISISINSGRGNVSGTLTQTATLGSATFDDILFDAEGFYSLTAVSGTLTQDISSNIAVIGLGVSIFPNGNETMNTIGSTSSIAEHDAGIGFVNSGFLNFSGGGVDNEADIRDSRNSSGYTDASGGANVFFTSTSGTYGFAIEGIDASAYSNLTLQFAVRKENVVGTDFATLATEYWDGDSWESITISDYPTSADNSGWYLLNPVVLPVAAEISNLGLRWVKTGAIRCRIDDINLIGKPKITSQLIVTTINGGQLPMVGTPFDVELEVHDKGGSLSSVLEDTDVELTLDTGTGILGGTLTTTISVGTSSSTISGITYSASETGVIVTANRSTGDDLQSGSSTDFSVLPLEPITSASSIIINDITNTTMNFNWTVGGGAERIVVARQGAAVDQNPIDGIKYTANADFTLGEDIGNGNIIVYVGDGNSVSITNLQPYNSEYHFAIYEYNGVGNLLNYKQTDPALSSALTANCKEPLAQTSSLIFSDITQSTMNLSWTDGDGSGRIVFVNSTNTFVDPVNGVDSHVADPSWNNSGQQVVYFLSEPGSSISISNLSASTTYYFSVYEFNCNGESITFKTDIYSTASVKTNLAPPDNPENRTVSGTVATYSGEIVEQVTVQIRGEDSQEIPTDSNGDFAFSVARGSDYILSASKFDVIKMNAAVTTVDIIKSRRHILQIQEFASPYQTIAADVNLSKSLTALDLVQMRKVVLGINEGFNNASNWLFIPQSYNLSADPFIFDTNWNITLLDQDLNMDFVAVKIGDVNNSWSSQRGARVSTSNIEFSLEHVELEGEFVEIPIIASGFDKMSGYQFSITWDQNQLEYLGVEHVALEGYYNEEFINEGILTTLWYENHKSLDIDNGTVLFKLKFKLNQSHTNSLVELNSTVTKALAFDSKLNPMSINSIAAHVNLDELNNGSLELYQNVPNPIEHNTEIGFRISKAGKVKLSIINLFGETVSIHEQDYDAGIYSITWQKSSDFKPIPPGIYLYRLESNGRELIKKMLIK